MTLVAAFWLGGMVVTVLATVFSYLEEEDPDVLISNVEESIAAIAVLFIWPFFWWWLLHEAKKAKRLRERRDD